MSSSTLALSSQPEPALDHLYRSHHGWLHAWLRKRTGCNEQAADLAHDTFLRLLVRRDDMRGVREPRAYLTTIAHGLMVNHWRRQDIERAYLEALAVLPEAVAPSPEARQLVIEALEAIALMLDGLPARVREVFLLSQLDGLTYPQIAAQLGITVNVVQKAMIRAVTHCYAVLHG